MTALAVYVGVVQFLFATTWTLYVLYLPPLAQQAGLSREAVAWILAADQLVFAAMDVATGYWVDRVRAGLARLGGWILGGTLVSGAAFVVLPFAGASASLLLVAIVVWAVTSSALRAPPWVLLSRYAPTPSVPWLATLVLLGTAVASALAPYLGIALRGIDARVPFVLSTATLAATVIGLRLAEKRLPPNPPSEPKPLPPLDRRLFFVAMLFLAIGFQVHFGLNSAPRYVQLAPREQLPWLMPVFWIGFSLAMPLASRLLRRWSMADALVVAAQLLAGGFWGAAMVAGYSAAVAFGRGGSEGRFLGSLFAVLAAAGALRLALAASGAAQTHAFSVLQPWLPETLWISAALVLLAAQRR